MSNIFFAQRTSICKKVFTLTTFWRIIYMKRCAGIDMSDIGRIMPMLRLCANAFGNFMHRVITIARQYGSRGREIGRAVAELTGSKFYDNNLITMSAQKTGISSDKLVDADEKIPNSVLYTLATGSSIFANTISPSIQPINDRLFFAQSDLIKSLAAQGPSVFVGRCADSVLEGREHILRVFFYADFTHRVNEICKRHSLSESEAKSIIIKTDRHRANYYNYYTGRKWGKPENYDLMLATDRLTTEQAAQIVASLAGLY